MTYLTPTMPIGHLSAGRISDRQAIGAKLAICRHARGSADDQPRWRRGSNSWRPTSPYALRGGAPAAACPACGCDGGELAAARSFDGDGWVEVCTLCQEVIELGDYNWNRLADCLRYRADCAAGLVEQPGEERCRKCGITVDEYEARGGRLYPVEPLPCDVNGCGFGADAPAHRGEPAPWATAYERGDTEEGSRLLLEARAEQQRLCDAQRAETRRLVSPEIIAHRVAAAALGLSFDPRSGKVTRA